VFALDLRDGVFVRALIDVAGDLFRFHTRVSPA
jgi:hypothetical protein